LTAPCGRPQQIRPNKSMIYHPIISCISCAAFRLPKTVKGVDTNRCEVGAACAEDIKQLIHYAAEYADADSNRTTKLFGSD
jgi:hypothetical protein